MTNKPVVMIVLLGNGHLQCNILRIIDLHQYENPKHPPIICHVSEHLANPLAKFKIQNSEFKIQNSVISPDLRIVQVVDSIVEIRIIESGVYRAVANKGFIVNPLPAQNVNTIDERRGSVASAVALGGTATPLAVRPMALATTQEIVRSDEKLFGLAIGGDRDALGELIGRYEKNLFALLLRMTGGDEHRADDLFQETFLHAMRAAKTFDSKLQFKPWITAIAVNLVRDEARKRKVRGEVGLDSPSERDGDGRYEGGSIPEPVASGDTPGERAERRDEERKVQRALGGLTELEREVVLLHFYNSMTLAETAKVLEAPLGTIKSRLHAALTRLSGLLEKP